MTLVLGNLTFPGKPSARRYVVQYLHKTPLGPLPEDAYDWMIALLARHPNFDQKWQDVMHIEIGTTERYNTRCIYLVRRDGSKVDISYTKALYNRITRRMYKYDVKKAFRYAILSQINAFREAAFMQLNECEMCGCELHHGNTSVDHDFTKVKFSTLVREFCALHGHTIHSVPIRSVGIEKELEDDAFREAWVAYHADHAVLRLLCIRCNNLEVSSDDG